MFGGKKCLICLWLVIIIALDFMDNFRIKGFS
ncbi:hypothetical protein HPSNT_02755 [Helicobacter pylori SNT49]|uniref:Uncharacterized protein n=1 Tax=Helicobacter pylori SNT49 TaxID=1055530 RepID=G2ME29_HELPX|nr:hypothetical protein HPSNT_02755 [Helicobacter pylori SNT49]